MSDFFDFCAGGLLSALWRGVWQGSIALIAVGGICRFVPRLPAALRCWLWRLAYVRLLVALFLPATLALPLLPTPIFIAATASYPAPIETAQEPNANAAPSVTGGVGHSDRKEADLRTSLQSAALRNPAMTYAGRPLSPKPEARNPKPALWLLIALAYLMGVAFCLTRLVIAYHRTRRLTEGATTITDSALIAEYAALAARLSLRQKPALFVSPTADGPALVGKGFGAAIVLPETLIDAAAFDERRMALAHELAHAARHDLAWDWLGVAAQTLFFFHPLVYLSRREERAAREMACDALAVSLTAVKPATYGRLLLAIATRAAVPRPAPLVNAVGAVEKGTILMRRIEALKDISGRRISRRVVFGVAIALAIAFIPFRLAAQAAKPRREESAKENADKTPPFAARKPSRKGEIEEFTGIAVTSNGRAVSGAKVQWIADPDKTARVVATTDADAHGRFRFRLANAPRSYVQGKPYIDGIWIAQAAGGQVGWDTVSLAVAPVNSNRLLLSAPGTHEARFLTPDGKPIANLLVTMRWLSGDGGTLAGAALQKFIGGVKVGRTDANGRFLITGMPLGKWAMFDLTGDDYAIAAQEAKPSRSRFLIRYTCVPATTISGTVRLPDGKPAAGIHVFGQRINAAGSPSREGGDLLLGNYAKTGGNGEYVVRRLVPGHYRLSFRAENRPLAGRSILTETTRERPAINADTNLTPGAIIQGTVTDARTGKPLPGVGLDIEVRDGEAKIFDNRAETNGEGRYSLRVPAGTATMQLLYDARRMEIRDKRRQEHIVREGETVTQDFALPSKDVVDVVGVVIDPQGESVPGATIRFFADIPLPREIYADKFGRFKYTGRFSASAVRLVARKGDYSASTTLFPGVNVPEFKLRLSRSPLSVVTGRVTDEKGRPISGAKLLTIGREPGTNNTLDFDELTTSAQGRFYGKVWPEFDYLLSVEAKLHGWKYAPNDPRHNLHLSPGEKRDVGSLVLRTANSFVAGTLLDETGKPVGDAMVSVGDLQTFGFLSRTDALGKFRVGEIHCPDRDIGQYDHPDREKQNTVVGEWVSGVRGYEVE